MSIEVEDDTELRDLVTTSLQTSGVLGKIKAQLRSNVYLAIEGDHELKSKSQHVNPMLDSFAATSEGRLTLQLIHEFFEFFELDYTQLVYEPEALEGRDITIRNRDKLIDHLGLTPETLNNDMPLLHEVIKLSKVSILKSETPTLADSNDLSAADEEDSELAPSLSVSDHVSESRLKIATSSAEKDGSLNATYTLNTTNKNEECTMPPVAPPKSFLADLPPLGGGSAVPPIGKPPNVNLAPLKKVPPPVAKVEATKKEGTNKFDVTLYGIPRFTTLCSRAKSKAYSRSKA